ncbi:unnamed protein product [Effrenium voratum]|nr:unnamed protein product [Effrenium voratum]
MGVLGNLMLLLGNGISSPSQQSSVVGAEVLHILSVLTNYSHEFAEEVLKQATEWALARLAGRTRLSPKLDLS